ncbi:MAG: 23S rRNA (uracil(1939)-C(5))-methyltransferase RlmD [Gammaproteobacteria bacterium]
MERRLPLSFAYLRSAGARGPLRAGSRAPPLCEARSETLSADGRGVAHIDGKTVFIDGALAGEQVMFRYLRRRGRFDEGVADRVLEPSLMRVPPRCPHFGVCGGCSLQHLASEGQIEHKQRVLLEGLLHLGKVRPETVLPPITGPLWGYRRKARLSVKYVDKKGGILAGFKEKGGRWVADLSRCEVLHPSIGLRLNELRLLVQGLSVARAVPQIEIAVGDEESAIVIRHLAPLASSDEDCLKAFSDRTGIAVYLQAGGPETVVRLWPPGDPILSYRLPGQVEIRFLPLDFTQVNAEINRALVERVLALLEPLASERVLDLFCGLGNFTLPLARQAGFVTGVEGERTLVERGRANAAANGIMNVEFHACDLADDTSVLPIAAAAYDKVLLDPPRTGASRILRRLPLEAIKRLAYVSCNPATLARDSAVLVREKGLRFVAAGVLDMFPHTSHVESIAVFEHA